MFEGFDVRETSDGYFWLYHWNDGTDNMFDGKFYFNLTNGG